MTVYFFYKKKNKFRTNSDNPSVISASSREQSKVNRKLPGSVLSREQLVSHLAAFDLSRHINLATFLMKGCRDVSLGPLNRPPAIL